MLKKYTTFEFNRYVTYTEILETFNHLLHEGEGKTYNSMIYLNNEVDHGCEIDSNDIFRDTKGVDAVLCLFGVSLSDDDIYDEDQFVALNNAIWKIATMVNDKGYKIIITEN